MSWAGKPRLWLPFRGYAVRFLFAWYDLWVGAFWDARGRRLYILPLPMIGVVIQFPPKPDPFRWRQRTAPWGGND